jgi:hypothetical protein
MVGNCHPLLASAKEAAGRTRKNMTPRTSHKGEKQNHALEKCIAAANRGWMARKISSPADQVKCFFLTSPFIEPASREDKGIGIMSPVFPQSSLIYLMVASLTESVKRALKSGSASFHISRADEKWLWAADSCPFAL